MTKLFIVWCGQHQITLKLNREILNACLKKKIEMIFDSYWLVLQPIVEIDNVSKQPIMAEKEWW